MKKYLYITKRSMIGRTYLNLIADKCPFEKDDVVYISSKEGIVNSRWMVASRTNARVTLKKIPERTISIDHTEVLGNQYTKKFNVLPDDEAIKLERYFVHKIKIYPYYDMLTENLETNSVLSMLKEADFEIETYINVLTNTKNVYNNGFVDNYNLLINEKYGVITFKCIQDDIFDNGFEKFMEELNSVDVVYASLLNSNFLTNDGNTLNIKYKKIFIFESEKKEYYYKNINDMLCKKGYNDQVVMNIDMFKDFLQDIENKPHICLNDEKRLAIIQLLMPKYINSKNSNLRTTKLNFIPDGMYELDDNQKDVLEKMNQRTNLKAAAGSGKTILLLAKAYEVASANPEKKFMILCWNRKLSEDINIQAENTGKIRDNLRISTFDSFIYDEVTKYVSDDDDKTISERQKIFIEKVHTGAYDPGYGGIFIDEMQQMKEEWLQALLKCTDDNKYMILAGDYYQKIRRDDLEEDNEFDDEIDDENTSEAFYVGDYEFKKIILDRNYRNTEDIVKVLDKMLTRINRMTKELKIPITEEEINVVRGKACRKSLYKPRYYLVTNEKQEIKQIINCISELLRDYNYNQSDILLLSPWGSSQSHMIYVLLKELKKYGIKICDFSNYREGKLLNDGVRVGTIGKSIGLDFKAVIIFGTSMMNSSKIESFKFDRFIELERQSNKIKREFISYLKNLYVACSRARDTLIVIDDCKDLNLISLFLRLVGEEENGK